MNTNTKTSATKFILRSEVQAAAQPAIRTVVLSNAIVSTISIVFKFLAVLAVVGLVGTGLGYAINKTFFKMVQISGSSMVPTLAEGSRHMVNLWEGHASEIHHNDIVVFRDPGDHGLSVKRVIGVPGDSIMFRDGVVFRNGEQLNEDYLMANVHTFTYSQKKEQLITLGVDQYFLLGDNRPVSIDSRAYGPVTRDNILGLLDVKPQAGL